MQIYKSVWSTSYGRCLISTVDVPRKSLILIENALLFAPGDDVEDKTAAKTLMCLGCCRSCPPSGKERRCNSCNWYICSEKCEKMKCHAENECLLFAKNKISFPPPHQWPILYKTIFVLRSLLTKVGDPRVWINFLGKLEHHSEARSRKPGCYKGDEMIIENIYYFFNNCDCPFTDEEIRIVCGVINVNAFSAVESDENTNVSRRSKCLFEMASLFTNSCSPNCSWDIRFDYETNNNGATLEKSIIKIEVVAAVPIRKGEMLTILYSTRYALYGTLKRIVLMEEIAHFVCKCNRCTDKTELGTYMSAVKCFDCRKNYLLPEDSTNMESRWKCIAPHCAITVSVNKIVGSIARIEEQVEQLEEQILTTEEKLSILLEMFQKYSVEFLHKNHYVLQEMSTKILQLLVASKENILDEDNSSESQLAYEEVFVTHCQYLLKIAYIILPAMTGYLDTLEAYLETVQRKTKNKIDTSKNVTDGS